MAQIDIPDFDKVQLSPPRLIPGAYTFTIHERPEILTNENGKSYLNLPLKVVDGPPQEEPDPATGSLDPKGRVTRDRLYLTPGAAWRVKTLLIATGILARDDTASPIAQGKFNSDILIGTTFQANVTMRMAEGKEYTDIAYIA